MPSAGNHVRGDSRTLTCLHPGGGSPSYHQRWLTQVDTSLSSKPIWFLIQENQTKSIAHLEPETQGCHWAAMGPGRQAEKGACRERQEKETSTQRGAAPRKTCPQSEKGRENDGLSGLILDLCDSQPLAWVLNSLKYSQFL